MKTILILVVPLIICIGIVAYIPFIPVSAEKLPSGILINYQRQGGIAGFNDDISIDTSGKVFKSGVLFTTLSEVQLADLKDRITYGQYSVIKTSLIEMYKAANKKEVTYPDMMTVNVRIHNTSGTAKIVADTYVTDLMSQFTGLAEPTPVISSISPTSGPIGTIVELKGVNLSGFEGDLIVTFEQAGGKGYVLKDTFGDYAKTAGSLIKVTVKEPCQKGEIVIADYSGKSYPCEYDPMTPGVYKVYTEPWGKKSNVVEFTVTQ